ncbi:PAS domain-containing protein [Ferrovibrio terrae]|uniref:PAS domain-containing protein n=1 Tax=Ferrovibrio terrae TaxID=2594003 RepID=UPI003137CA99
MNSPSPLPQPSDATGLRFNATGAADTPQPDSPVLQQLLRYWESKRAPDGRLPARRDLDPLEIRSLLPHIYLIDVVPGSTAGRLRFRIRLLGEKHVDIYGTGLVGRMIDDIFPAAVAAEFTRLYAAVARRRAPVINRGQVSWIHNKDWLQYEGLHAPLAADGVTIDTIFGAGAFVGFE